MLKQVDWRPLSYSYKLVLLKHMYKAFHDELPQVPSDNIVMKLSSARLSNGASFQLYLWQKLYRS